MSEGESASSKGFARAISKDDQQRLKDLIARIRSVEARDTNGVSVGDLKDDLRQRICELQDSAEPLVARLASLSRMVDHIEDPSSVQSLLAPLERILGRALYDHEFLFEESDGQARSLAPSAVASSMVLVGENLRSAFNIGALFRTAEAFGVEEFILTGYSATPMDASVQKTAMGTAADLKWRQSERTEEAIKELRERGYRIVGLETDARAVAIGDYSWSDRTALIIGNERFGLNSETREKCDDLVRIPLAGRKNSLNVGVASGIALGFWSRPPRSASASEKQTLEPIGHVRSPFRYPQEIPFQGAWKKLPETVRSLPARIELVDCFRGQKTQIASALSDLAGCERVWVIFGFHKSSSERFWTHPPRGGRARGIFATRAPHRPNRLGLSCVRLQAIEDDVLIVDEHDFLDGTPVFDIKPYVPDYDAFMNIRSGWIDDVGGNGPYSLQEAPRATDQIDWLEAQGAGALRSFLWAQLCYNPLNSDRKRVSQAEGDVFEIAFRTWRVRFQCICKETVATSDRPILISSVHSGWSVDNLSKDSADPFGDKATHRAFRARFS